MTSESTWSTGVSPAGGRSGHGHARRLRSASAVSSIRRWIRGCSPGAVRNTAETAGVVGVAHSQPSISLWLASGSSLDEGRRLGVLVQLRLPAPGGSGRELGAVHHRDRAVQRLGDPRRLVVVARQLRRAAPPRPPARASARARRRRPRRTAGQPPSCRSRRRVAAGPTARRSPGTPCSRARSASSPPVVSATRARPGARRRRSTRASPRCCPSSWRRAPACLIADPGVGRVAAAGCEPGRGRGRRWPRRPGRRRWPSRPSRTPASPPASVARRDRRGLDAPERVADLVRLGADVVEHPHALTVAPGSMRAPAATRAPSAITAPAPTIAPGSIARARRRPSRPRRARTRAGRSPLPPITRSCSTAALDRGGVAHRAVRAQHRLRADVRAGRQTPGADQRPGLVARRQAGLRRARRAGPRWPRGSARGCRCPSSSPRPGSRRGRCRPASGTPRARTRRRARRAPVASITSRSIT